MTIIWGIVQTDDGPVRVNSDEELFAAMKRNTALQEASKKALAEAFEIYRKESLFAPFVVEAKD